MLRKVSDRLRASLYSIRFSIGSGCSYGRIKFWDCEKNPILIRNTELCFKTTMPFIIGDNTFINQRCIIRTNTEIGRNVSIAPNVSLMTNSHEIGESKKRAGKSIYNPIKINSRSQKWKTSTYRRDRRVAAASDRVIHVILEANTV